MTAIFPTTGWRDRSRALDVAEGDVATLSGRLAQIRTFTYAAHRPGWTRDGAHWQGETRAVEDRLSDALHERLTQRFIDRRTSVLMKHLREDEIADLTLDESGGVAIGGEAIGRLDGFRFTPDPRAAGDRHGACRPACAPRRCGDWKANSSRAPRALAAAADTAITPQRAWQAVVGRRDRRHSWPPAPRRSRRTIALLADEC